MIPPGKSAWGVSACVRVCVCVCVCVVSRPSKSELLCTGFLISKYVSHFMLWLIPTS